MKKAVKKAPAKKAVKKAPAKKAAVKKAVKKAPAKKAAAKKAVKKAKSPFGKKFIGEMKARLVEERAKYLHSEETYRAEADALIEGREPGDVQFDEESGEGDTLAVERERDLALSNQARQAVEQIDAALDRIKAGTYGICVASGSRFLKSAFVRSRGPQNASSTRLAASATASESGRADEADMSDQHLIETLPEAFHGERIDRVVSAIAGISRSLAKN